MVQHSGRNTSICSTVIPTVVFTFAGYFRGFLAGGSACSLLDEAAPPAPADEEEAAPARDCGWGLHGAALLAEEVKAEEAELGDSSPLRRRSRESSLLTNEEADEEYEEGGAWPGTDEAAAAKVPHCQLSKAVGAHHCHERTLVTCGKWPSLGGTAGILRVGFFARALGDRLLCEASTRTLANTFSPSPTPHPPNHG